MDYVTAILLGVVTVLVLYNLVSKTKSRYPSGPFAFPVIGNLPQLVKSGCFTAFANYYKKIHGNVSQNFLSAEHNQFGFEFLLTVLVEF